MSSTATERRRKRLMKRGDRQYFAAVRKIRREKIDKWQLEHKPGRFARRLNQLAAQAARRQLKQEARDRAREKKANAS